MIPEHAEECPFALAVRCELARSRGHWIAGSPEANAGFPPLNSLHEACAVIKEEYDELWEQCRLRPERRSKERTLKELIQIGAMAQRAAEDLNLIAKESA